MTVKHVFLIAGENNAIWQDVAVNTLPSAYGPPGGEVNLQQAQPAAKVWDTQAGAFVDVDASVNPGPHVALAPWLVEKYGSTVSEPNVYFVLHGVASTGLDYHDISDSPGVAYSDWSVERYDRSEGTSHLKNFLNTAVSALDSIVANADTPSVEGFYWSQGEDDTRGAYAAHRYYYNFLNLHRRVKERLRCGGFYGSRS